MLLSEAKKILKAKGYFLNESDEELPPDCANKTTAEVAYYVCRFITNKGPQTLNKIDEYLKEKLGNDYSKEILYTRKNYFSKGSDLKTDDLEEMVYDFCSKNGRRFELKETGKEKFENIYRPWHEGNDDDPYNKVVKMFWDWYQLKKKGEITKPDKEVIKLIQSPAAEKAFGKYYKFASTQLADFMTPGSANVSEEDMLIKDFWDWHRAKKAGKPYNMSNETVNGLIQFLKRPKAIEVLQQYYYYFVRVIENIADYKIKTPINTDGLQKELKRIMDNLDNDDFVKDLEQIEINRLHGGSRTAGPVFVLPKEVILDIRDMARDPKNVDKSKVGKIDKSQVKECYIYCNNELNRKFHIGKTGVFDLNIQDFYDTYKIVFQRGFNTKTLYKIFDEVCQYLLDQLDQGTADYWKNRGKLDVDDVDDFNEAFKHKHKKIIYEKTMLDGNDWYKELISELNSEEEYNFVDSCFDDDYKEFVLDGDFIFWNDNWQCYADKDGYGSDDLYEIAPLENYNYDDLVAEFGTPSEYIKKCLKHMK